MTLPICHSRPRTAGVCIFAPMKKASVHYSVELVTEICQRVVEGEYLKKICREEGMPHYTTFFDWVHKHPEAEAAFGLAREMGGHWCVDTIREMCEETPEKITDDKGVERIDTGWVQLLRTRIDAFKWMASKFYPKMYGERMELKGEVGVNHTVTVRQAQDAAAAIAAAADPNIASRLYAELVNPRVH